MTCKEAAVYMRMSIAWLAHQRMAGTGPQYVRLGERAVRYRRSDLDRYIADGECIIDESRG
jgi:predicted DNA-binding transcriptional regulator AlpA